MLWRFIPSSFCSFFRLFSCHSLICLLPDYLLSTCALGSLFIVLQAWPEFSVNYTHHCRHSNIPPQQDSTDQITEIYLPSRGQKSSDQIYLVDRFANILQFCRHCQPSQWHHLFIFWCSSLGGNRETWTGCDSGAVHSEHSLFHGTDKHAGSSNPRGSEPPRASRSSSC